MHQHPSLGCVICIRAHVRSRATWERSFLPDTYGHYDGVGVDGVALVLGAALRHEAGVGTHASEGGHRSHDRKSNRIGLSLSLKNQLQFRSLTLYTSCSTEIHWKACTWFSACFLLLLNSSSWVLLSKRCRPFIAPLYTIEMFKNLIDYQ